MQGETWRGVFSWLSSWKLIDIIYDVPIILEYTQRIQHLWACPLGIPYDSVLPWGHLRWAGNAVYLDSGLVFSSPAVIFALLPWGAASWHSYQMSTPFFFWLFFSHFSTISRVVEFGFYSQWCWILLQFNRLSHFICFEFDSSWPSFMSDVSSWKSSTLSNFFFFFKNARR